ncbi:outer membrane protein [Paracoccus niistensis]|uniref:Outer membrane protein n=1 Tax=Paracoccus niistensis TaxID=632935 RepID=A0ABV6I6G5_9RHOB
MKTTFLAALISGSAAAAMAGGYAAPVVEVAPAAPVVVAAEQPTGDWTGFYAGLQYGKTEADIDGIDVDGDNYGVHAGYLRDFGRFVGGAELSYDKLDDFDVAGIDVDGDGNLLRGKLLAGYDAGKLLPYAAISLGRLEIDLGDDEESETGVGFGLGVKYMATPRFMLGAEWMRNNFEFDAGAGSDIDVDLDTLSLNAAFRF